MHLILASIYIFLRLLVRSQAGRPFEQHHLRMLKHNHRKDEITNHVVTFFIHNGAMNDYGI
jgi:hypothetical protein